MSARAPGLSHSPWRALVLVTLASASFASVQAAVKALGGALESLGAAASLAPPVFARGLVGALVIGAWARARKRPLRARGRKSLAVRCVAGGVAMVAVYAAVGVPALQVELGTASMLLKTAPLWVALLAPFALGEPTRRGVWLGILLGALGVALIYGQAPRGAAVGVSLCLLSGLLAAVAYMALRRLAETDDPSTVVFWFSLFLAAIALPALWPFLRGAAGHPARVWLALGVAGVCGTVGQLFLTEAYRWGSAALVTLGGLSGVVVAMLLDLWLFDKHPTNQAILGGALAVCAGLIAGRASRRVLTGETEEEE